MVIILKNQNTKMIQTNYLLVKRKMKYAALRICWIIAKNVPNSKCVAKISVNNYNDVLLNKKCLSHSMSRIQRKYCRIRTYEINKIYFSCFDDKTCFLDNGTDASAFDA